MTAPVATPGPGTSLGFLLWHATLRWQRELALVLKQIDLTHVQFVLLASIWWLADEQGHQPTQRALAEHAGTDPMMTSQVVRTLESRGLVGRTPSPDDGRAMLVSATREGAALARRAVVLVGDADRAFFEPVVGRRLEVTRLLQRLAQRRGVPQASGSRLRRTSASTLPRS